MGWALDLRIPDWEGLFVQADVVCFVEVRVSGGLTREFWVVFGKENRK